MTVSSALDTATHAEELRRRLIRTAYSLHFAAAETAALFDLHPDVAAAGGAHNADGASWRAVSQEAVAIARVWGNAAHCPSTASAARPAVEAEPVGPGGVAPTAEAATRRLSAAATQLDALLPGADPQLRQQLNDARDQIREAVRDLRHLMVPENP